MSDLRNISCPMLPSKIYESYILNWLSSEVKFKSNQYGWVKGCSVSHPLVDMWDEALGSLEDERAAVLIMAIDYVKTFNCLSFQHCLQAFAKTGASTETLALFATFLSGRTMSVRVCEVWSNPQPVYGGVPQGLIQGVLLFNVLTDDLEDDNDCDPRSFVYDKLDPHSEPLKQSWSEESGLDPPDQSSEEEPSASSETGSESAATSSASFSLLLTSGESVMSVYSNEDELEMAPEVNRKVTGFRWKVLQVC